MKAAAKLALADPRAPIPENLPRYLTTFIGRENELARLGKLLASTRLITLTGPGGAGKSRMAAQLVSNNRDRWPDGVWWVELAPLADSRQVPVAVVATMELPGRGPAQEVVMAWLAGKRALLVLDNCEHLVAACATFSQAALERCAELTVIATSREPLGVPGEAIWPVTSLQPSDAMRLFESRARLIKADFKVSPQDVDSVTAICEQLDGLPLAVEMAAGRMGIMSTRELQADLGKRLHPLSTGARVAPDRHRTMVATIDWSHKLLTEGEARLFRRVSVFRGGFTLESAQAVCADGDESIFDLLTGLVQKSMVMAERTEDAGGRFRLLEMQLAYAEEKLRDAGELETVRRAHYEFFLAGLLARTELWRYASEKPFGVAEEEWKAHEWANLHGALTWAREGAADKGLGLAARMALTGFGDHSQARATLRDLLEHSPQQGVARVQALDAAAWLAHMQGDPGVGLPAAEAALAMARELADVDIVLGVLMHLRAFYFVLSNATAEAEVEREAASLLSRVHPRLRNAWRHNAAIRAGYRGENVAARNVLTECVAFSRSIHDAAGLAPSIASLAEVQLDIGDIDAATSNWTESLLLSRDFKDRWCCLYCLIGLSWVASNSVDDQRAIRLAGAASRIRDEWSLSWETGGGRQQRFEAALEQSRNRLGAGRSEKAWTEGTNMSLERAIDYALSKGEPAAVKAGPLSRREREVVGLVTAGMTNREIGARLFISERTAEGHVERIRHKLGIRSRAGVAAWAAEHGLTEDIREGPIRAPSKAARSSD